jgi:hypothetical protein
MKSTNMLRIYKRTETILLLSALILLSLLLNPVADAWSVPSPVSKARKQATANANLFKNGINGNQQKATGANKNAKAAPVNAKSNPASAAPPRGGTLQLPPRITMPEPPQMMRLNNNEEERTKMRGNGVFNSATAATLSLLASFVPPDTTAGSEQAAKVTLQSFPPTTIQLDLRDIPLLGGMISGTWAKVAPLKKTTPSIVVASPTEKFGAIRNFLDRGRLEFDIGGLITTHLNVDVEPNDQGGEALIRLSSKLIPKWPFGRNTKSNWNRVTNMGNGETYYFDSVSGEAQYEEPDEFL